MKSLIFWLLSITLGHGQSKEYLARTMPKWKALIFSLIVGIVVSLILALQFIPESFSNFLQNLIPDKDNDFYFFTELGICVVITFLVISLPLNNFICKAMGEINRCPECSGNASFKLQKEEVIGEKVISEKSGKGYKNYRVGSKRGYFKCCFCGFEDYLDTSYKISA